jgi:hypothetical protein
MTVSSDAKDPSLYDGLAYFVPLLKAQEWMREREGQKQEVSFFSCMGFFLCLTFGCSPVNVSLTMP